MIPHLYTYIIVLAEPAGAPYAMLREAVQQPFIGFSQWFLGLGCELGPLFFDGFLSETGGMWKGKGPWFFGSFGCFLEVFGCRGDF